MVTTANTKPTPRWWQQEALDRELTPYRQILSGVEQGAITGAEGLHIMRRQMAEKPIPLLYDPRLGKTGTVYLIYEALDGVWVRLQELAGNDPEPLRFLIVAPNRIMSVWETEAKKWLPAKIAKSMVTVRSDDIRGENGATTREAHLEVAEMIEPRFTVLSYEFFAREVSEKKAAKARKHFARQAAAEIKKVADMLASGFFQGIVLDESHNLGNNGSLKRDNAFALYFDKCLRFALTGTPFPNKIDKLYATLAYTHPGRLRVAVGESRPGRSQYQDFDRLKPEERQAFYHPANAMHRIASPVWGSEDEFLRMYGEYENGGYGNRLVGGTNLTPETCRACPTSRCRSPQYHRSWRGECPKLNLPVNQRLKACLSCTLPVDPRCYDCQTPLHTRLVEAGFDRRTKQECLPESDSTFDNVLCRMTPDQERLYSQIRQRRIVFQQLQAAGQVTMGVFELKQHKLAEVTSARLAATDPEQWYQGLAKRSPGDPRLPAIQPPKDRRSGKIEWLKAFFEDELDDLEETKVICFTEWSTTAGNLKKEFARYNPALLIGGMPSRLFDGEVARYTTDPSCRLLISTATGFEGVDLSAQGETGYIVMVNPMWIPGKVKQAVERATNPQWPRTIQVLHLLSVYQNGDQTVDLVVNLRNVGKVITQNLANDGGKIDESMMFDGPELEAIFDAL